MVEVDLKSVDLGFDLANRGMQIPQIGKNEFAFKRYKVVLFETVLYQKKLVLNGTLMYQKCKKFN
jgi:hypothetical protein